MPDYLCHTVKGKADGHVSSPNFSTAAKRNVNAPTSVIYGRCRWGESPTFCRAGTVPATFWIKVTPLNAPTDTDITVLVYAWRHPWSSHLPNLQRTTLSRSIAYMPGRSHLRSPSTLELVVHLNRQSTVGDRWHRLPEATSLLSLLYFLLLIGQSISFFFDLRTSSILVFGCCSS